MYVARHVISKQSVERMSDAMYTFSKCCVIATTSD